MRYENKSTIFTTNATYKSWGDIFQDPKLANAILDRILHHSTVVNIVEESYPIKDHFQTEDKSEAQLLIFFVRLRSDEENCTFLNN